MAELTLQTAVFIIHDKQQWFGPPVLAPIPILQIPTEAIDSVVYDGRTRLKACRMNYLEGPVFGVPSIVTSDSRVIAKELLLAGHYERAYLALDECWRDCPRSIQSHLGVTMQLALSCFAARRQAAPKARRAQKRESLRLVARIRAYLVSVEEGTLEFDPEMIREIVGF